jgi:hypothetical protein
VARLDAGVYEVYQVPTTSYWPSDSCFGSVISLQDGGRFRTILGSRIQVGIVVFCHPQWIPEVVAVLLAS